MSVMYNHYQSEYGFNISKNYDLAINRLKCVHEDIFRSTRLQGSDLEITDSPMIVSRFSKIPQFENILATGNEDGIVMIHNTGKHLWSSERNSSKVVAQTHLNVIFDLAWSPSSYQLVTASGDHTAVLWDVRDDELKYLYRFHGHSRSIKTISFKPEDKHVFATGGRDGLVIIWDTRLAKPDVQTVPPDNIIASNNVQTREFYKKRNPLRMDSITSVIFKNSFAVISGSAYDPLIKVWDIRNSYSAYKRTPLPRYKMLIPDVKKTSNGVSSLVMDSTGTRMYANCMDGTIYCYNTSTYLEQPIMSYRGHQNSSFYVKSCLSPDDRYLISGSSDDSAYIWNIKKQDPIGRLVGHSAEVTTIDWSKSNETKLLTCSDDGSCRVWRLHYKTFEKEELKGWFEPLKVTKNTTLENFKSCSTSCHIKRGIQEQTDFQVVHSKKLKCEDERTALSHHSLNSLHHKPCLNTKKLESPVRYMNNDIEISSPTANLPNHVIDGTSPHHCCTVNRQKENQNWLQKLQQGTPPPYNSRVTPKRKVIHKSSKRCRENLLKFFKASAKQNFSQGENQKSEVFAEPIPLVN